MFKILNDSVVPTITDSDLDELVITDSNFESLKKDFTDSIASVLANAGLAIAEQKKLLQRASGPSALNSAIKLLAITAGNLLNAGTGMLNWLSNQLPQRDSCTTGEKVSDKKIDGYELQTHRIVGDGSYAILFSELSEKYLVVGGYDKGTGEWETEFFNEVSTFARALKKLDEVIGGNE